MRQRRPRTVQVDGNPSTDDAIWKSGCVLSLEVDGICCKMDCSSVVTYWVN
uniref:Uncharacterized protein n=1 Tax=Arundo donax TaxID=35708 RepID=A0A0A8XRL1_ARUDO